MTDVATNEDQLISERIDKLITELEQEQVEGWEK